MRALIWRYIVNAHSEHEMEPVTEDDVHELKTDLSSWRCELLDILHKNGMDIGEANKKEKSKYFYANTCTFDPRHKSIPFKIDHSTIKIVSKLILAALLKLAVLGKKMKIWERRLMKDFQVTGPVNSDVSQEEITLQQSEDENNIERWKRIARLAVLTSAEHRWSQVRKISIL